MELKGRSPISRPNISTLSNFINPRTLVLWHFLMVEHLIEIERSISNKYFTILALWLVLQFLLGLIYIKTKLEFLKRVNLFLFCFNYHFIEIVFIHLYPSFYLWALLHRETVNVFCANFPLVIPPNERVFYIISKFAVELSNGIKIMNDSLIWPHCTGIIKLVNIRNKTSSGLIKTFIFYLLEWPLVRINNQVEFGTEVDVIENYYL